MTWFRKLFEISTVLSASPQDSISTEQLVKAYKFMLTARKVDEKSEVLYKQNKAHFQITCSGHEAIQVAFANAMKPGHDWAYPYYRDLAFSTAWGMSAKEHFLAILNKADDPCSGGRQMPNHFGHKELNIVSQSSPTGTQYLQSVGAAIACRRNAENAIVYTSSGEGTTAQGDYHEALNWAAREKLPVIFLIQDNQLAISTHISEQIAGGSVAKFSAGYQGLEIVEVDGLDYNKSFAVAKNAVSRARAGKGPSLVVANVVRLNSHSISDNHTKYRSKEELEENKNKDPLIKVEKELIEKMSLEKVNEIKKEIANNVQDASNWAEQQANPAPKTFDLHVYKQEPIELESEPTFNPQSSEEVFMVDALNQALDEEMTANPKMLIYGQDVAKGKGGVFTVTSNLSRKHGLNRCFNSPLAEASIVGTAIGLSTLGYKPVVEIQFGDYVWTAMMQIRNELAMMHYRSNGNFSCPAVIRVAVGGYIHGSLYHSQNIEATFAHFPGLKVVLPSNSKDAKALLKTAIRSNNPVLFLEHKGLYRQVYAKSEVGDKDFTIPLGKAKVVKEGSDATIVSWGALVNKSLVIANELAKEGKSIEVIDLRTILPLDFKTIENSLRKTSRLLIAHEDVNFMGLGAEISAQIADKSFELLDAPIKRVGGAFTPVPHAQSLEKNVLPQNQDIKLALSELLDY